MRTFESRCVLIGTLLFAAATGTEPAWSQSGRLPLPTDEIAALVNAADASVAAGDFDQAVQQWQAVLDLPEDSVDPSVLQNGLWTRIQGGLTAGPGRRLQAGGRADDDPFTVGSTTLHPSLKTRVEERLLSAPDAALDAYEQRFGPQARALLNDALRDHDRARLTEVVRRYFASVAGHRAAAVFAEQLADEGDALSAARLYDRLAKHPHSTSDSRAGWLLRAAACWSLAGFAETARARLANQGELGTAGRNDRDSGPAELQAWLEGRRNSDSSSADVAASATPAFRGNAQRNASFSPAVAVGAPVWECPTVDEHDFFLDEELVAELQASISQRMSATRQRYETSTSDQVLVPAGIPVAADGLAVFRGPGTIKAVSLATGELVWPSVTIDETFQHLTNEEWVRRDEDWHSVNLDLMLTQRMYRDVTFSSLSTDGRHVYALADGGMMSSVSHAATALPALIDHQLAPHAYNRLLAFELATGRLVREFGGPPTGDPLSGAYFLSAPLPLDGDLYCLVESQGQVQLVVLDQQSLDVEWTQALYNPVTNFSDPLGGMARRLGGVALAAAGDIVVCPSGETIVAAVDRRRRTILWTYEYQRPSGASSGNPMALRMLRARRRNRVRIEDELLDELLSSDHWQDAAPVIDGESVLLTLPDSDDLLCVGLVTGKEVWRRPRGDRQWIAAVDRGNVVLVGRDQVEALRVSDGEPAWEAPVSISRPGGRGFRHNGWYVLPLSTGEIAAIDLASGRIRARTPLPESVVHGNLVVADGRIVCQTADSVLAFGTLEELTNQTERMIAADPEDASALLQRGELLLHLGEEQDALESLRRAIRADPASPARRLLVETLTEGLRSDFAAYRTAAPEIESTATTVSEQARFHRLFAEGLQRGGEFDAAFEQYLRFADKAGSVAGLQQIDGMHQVRSDRWIAGRLEELISLSAGEEQAQLRTRLLRAADNALANGDASRVKTFRHAIEDRAMQARIDRQSIDSGTLTPAETESLRLRLLSSADRDQAARASAELANQWLAANRTGELLQQLLVDLAGPYRDVECLDGQTGAELLDAWRSDPERAALMSPPDPWPTADVVAEDRTRGVPSHPFPVEQMGPPSKLFSGWSFFTDTQGARLYAFDPLGRRAWWVATSLNSEFGGRSGPYYIRYVATYDRFLLLVVEDEWTLFDVFAGGDAPQVLANAPLGTDGRRISGANRFPGVNRLRRNRNRVWMDPLSGVTLGNVGPIENGMFVYQRGNRLAAVSVSTGQELWAHQRPGLPAGGDIMSDGRVVAVWPPNSDELQLFRAVDGSFLRSNDLPPRVWKPQPEGHWGAKLVTVDRGRGDGARFDLGLFDVVTQTHVWQRSLPEVRDWGVVDGRDFSVMHAGGALRVIDADDGQDLMTVELPDGDDAEAVTVWSDADRWYVATYRTPDDVRARLETSQLPLPDVYGHVLAVSKPTGSIEWTVPVVEHPMQLHRDNPGRWPFLMLSTRNLTPGSEPPKLSWSLLLLDKATGRPLLEKTVDGRAEQHGWLSDPERQRIHLAAGTVKVTLRFGDSSAEEAPEDEPQE